MIQAERTALVTQCILLDLLYCLRLSRPIVDDPQDVHNLSLLHGQQRNFSTPSSIPVWALGGLRHVYLSLSFLV